MTVLDHMLDELEKISNSMMGYNGMSTAGAQMSPPPSMPSPSPKMSASTPSMSSMGATAMKGMSTHCDKCFLKLPDRNVPLACPRCKSTIRGVRDIESAPAEKQDNAKEPGETHESGPTGGEAAVNEELAEGSYSDMGKYSQAVIPAQAKHTLTAIGALGGGLYLGNALRKMLSGQQQIRPNAITPQGEIRHFIKSGGVRHSKGSKLTSLNLHRRGGHYGSVEAGLQRIARATARHAKRITPMV